jgi:hypothetical protein
MPDIEHRPKPARLRKLRVFSKSVYLSICTRPGSLWPSHGVSLWLEMETGSVRCPLTSLSLQRDFHWTPFLGQKATNLIFMAVQETAYRIRFRGVREGGMLELCP